MRRLPQVRDFGKLRLLLTAIAEGLRDAGSIGERMGAERRHGGRCAALYREAAEILGFVESDCWALTARGEMYLRTRGGSDEERSRLRASVLRALELGPLMNAILSPEEPDVAALIEEAVVEFPRYSRATTERRVNDTLSWRDYLGAQDRGPPTLIADRSAA